MYEEQMNITRLKMEHILRQTTQILRLQGMAGKQKEFMRQIVNIPHNDLIKGVD